MDYAALIKDNYILYGLPPVNSNLGVGIMNPAVQTQLGYTGFFDGLQQWSQWTLPSDMIYPLEMWERQAGTQLPFGMMMQNANGLSPRNQVQANGEWEWRTDGIWMHGSILSFDCRIRYICTYPALLSNLAGMSTTQVNAFFANTYVPIQDSQEAVADKIAARYARRLGGDAEGTAKAQAMESILRLKQQVQKTRQGISYVQTPFGANRAGASGNPATYLY
jgi:hypothetical protein